ncbi:hypothetical protein [Novipirellula rosea]|uniref:Glycosyl hydrolases family 43 n=1 Tax=Novipirellula rosea TaxID=1031540 RepID=A0ABP8N2H2_9BACT
MIRITIPSVAALLVSAAVTCPSVANEAWVIDTQEQWQQETSEKSQVEIKEGVASPTGETGTLRSTLKRFEQKRSAKSIVFQQSPIWQNWNPVDNIGPANLADAPVMLSLGPKNYWIFGRYGGAKKSAKKGASKSAFHPEPATLDGFDIPLMTTPFANQFDAPGGLNKGLGGYHAWQSRDMVNWVHHGPVTEGFSRWVTSAEHVDGKTYIYYDFPNDQDPHVYVDDDLTDGKPGKNMGKALNDPSHGSDSGFIRDLDGKFHVIFEDWSPINASKRSWDSPLAGHAVSDDGVSNFKILGAAVDHRTKPTGKIGTYKHPHWAKEDPENYKTNIAEYEIHEPEQEAFGDWAAISIGGQYYLFGDYDPEHGKPMSVAWFTSPSLDQPFTFCGNIGNGHPDPDIAFAEGQFYLVTQQKKDFTSPGPWVEQVETRVGVDTTGDGNVDHWSDWQVVKETYDSMPGFAKQIAKTPASLDLSDLPAGFGFQFEVKLTDTTSNESKPMLDKIQVSFEQ